MYTSAYLAERALHSNHHSNSLSVFLFLSGRNASLAIKIQRGYRIAKPGGFMTRRDLSIEFDRLLSSFPAIPAVRVEDPEGLTRRFSASTIEDRARLTAYR